MFTNESFSGKNCKSVQLDFRELWPWVCGLTLLAHPVHKLSLNMLARGMCYRPMYVTVCLSVWVPSKQINLCKRHANGAANPQQRRDSSFLIPTISVKFQQHHLQQEGVEYMWWNDVTESMVTIRSPFCGYRHAMLYGVDGRRFTTLSKRNLIS